MTDSDKRRKKTLYLVDGSGFIFRAFHALPPLTRPDGTPVGAVMGFCNMLLRIIEEANGDYVAVVFDAARRNFRYDIYPEYKANRGETPEDLVPQFPLVRLAAEAFGLMGIELEGFEADDLIAAYAKAAREKDIPVKIVSSDKDLMQLMRDGVTLFDPLKYQDMTLGDVEKKFGVTPDKVVDVQALAGDSTDNVPGVPGIGVKTAAQLILEYGNLETLLARAGEIKQEKRRQSLIENADKARISKQLVKLDDNAPLPVDLETLDDYVLDCDKLVAFLQEQGFRSLVARVIKKWGGTGVLSHIEKSAATEEINEEENIPGNIVPQIPVLTHVIHSEYSLVTDEAVLRKWVEEAFDAGVVGIDTETTSLTPAKADLVGISLCIKPGKACYVPLGHKQSGGGQTDLFGELTMQQDTPNEYRQIPMNKAMEILKPLLVSPAVIKVGHNIKYDMQMFFHHGIQLTPVHDTMLMSYVLDGSKNGHGLDELSELFLAHKNISYKEVVGSGKDQKNFSQISPEDACNYAAEDADMTRRLYDVFSSRLISEKMMRVYEDIERPLIPIIARMEWAGVKVDREFLSKLSGDFEIQIRDLEKTIFAETGQEFNLASPKQMGEVLFGSMGLPEGKKTKTGTWSTDAETLEKLAAMGHKAVADILEWRSLSKLKSTYTDALQEQINLKTGRVHTSYAMAITNTGRLSSSDPNLQNIPIRSELGRKIRTAFIARDGYKLISVDYSQIELRLMAELGKVQKLREAFAKGWDIHAMTASEVFGIPMNELTSERRRAAKAINFGIIYGISAFGLSKQLGCEVSEASNYIKLYMSRFPEINAFMERWKEYAKKRGYVETYFGRKIYVPEIQADNHAMRSFGERQAINAPLQGTAADIMKMAMRDVDKALSVSGLDATVLLQVHDELVIEVIEKDCEKVMEIVTAAMQGVVQFDVPLIADAGVGDNWGNAH